MNKTVCICGTNEITRGLIPWDDPAKDYWVMNESAHIRQPDQWTAGHRIDGVIQIHVPQIWRSDNGGHYPGYYSWLQQDHPGMLIWMIEQYDDVPCSVKYPKQEIIDRYAQNFVNEKGDVIEIFGSSAAYALGLAAWRGYERVELYGIEATSDTEYVRQKAGIAFWIGVLEASGVTVVRQSASLLLNEKPYGYTGEISIPAQHFEVAAAQLERETKKAEVDMNEAIGIMKRVLLSVREVMVAAGKTQTKRDQNAQLYDMFIDQLNVAQDAVFKYGIWGGKLAENQRYFAECRDLVNAAGGEKALAALAADPKELAHA